MNISQVNLSETKRALLAKQLQKARAKKTKLQTITRRPEGERVPLSFAQQRLWFLDQWKPGDSAFNIPIGIRLMGMLDVAALEQSINEIVRRHESLRTTFAMVDGHTVQVIAPVLTLPMSAVNFDGLSEPEAKVQLERMIVKEAQWPFDLTRGPLVRATLARVRDKEHVLFLNVHHIVSDAWSMGLLIKELGTLYRDFSTGQSSSLPELLVQYADFAAWQRGWLQGEVLETQLSYWKRQLGGDLPIPDLPTDRPRPPVQTHQGASLSVDLPKALGKKLKDLSQRREYTLFMVLLAAFKTLLYRYTGQTDILVGSPIAGRNWREVEGVIGFFLNTLVLRTDLSGDPSFLELLDQVRRVTLDAYDHQDVPFEKLLEELKPERDLSRTPLFQVFFNMLNIPDYVMEMSGLKAESLPRPTVWSKFDLTLYTVERGDVINLLLVFNADLFERDRMAEMLRQFEHLLWQIVENPRERITRFSLVTSTAKDLLPNPTLALRPNWEGAVHTLFSEQARRIPRQAAIVDKQGTWTYRELDVHSNRLANYLRDNGIQSRDVVAIYGHRSGALVWAVMGVLKAGAAFVILDPAYPAARLVECLRMANPRAWLQVEAAGALPDALDEFVVNSSYCCHLELGARIETTARGLLTEYSADDPGVLVGPDDLAYVAFTSGSTGVPKGILGRHRPLSHFLPWQRETFELDSTDRYSMLSGLSHDPLQRDIFSSLTLGATLCIPDPGRIGNPGWLAEWMRQEEISITHLTPAMMQLLTQTATGDTESVREIPSLRYAFIVGDVLTKWDVSRLQTLAPTVTCVNFYGSTETQRAVGYFVVPGDGDLIPREIIPLGQGIQDVQLLILNASQELTGIGELGEIHVHSPHLARGYLGDDALTRERFITNPFTKEPGNRLYKTGDLGRYLPDGNVAFQGRVDHQIKIRGFRIELGEIEAVLAQYPGVRETVVVALLAARENVADDAVALSRADKQLVAYVALDQAVAPTPQELRQFLREKLPQYMIPAVFVVLDAFPLTPNGKIDRRALPAPERSQIEQESAFVAPSTPYEEILVEVWEEVLGLEKIGVRDNFFSLGGHSLLATQIVSRVRDYLDIELPVRSLFEAPTVAEMALHIERALIAEIKAQSRTQVASVL